MSEPHFFYISYDNRHFLHEFYHDLEMSDYIAFDTETTGLHPYHGDVIIGYCFYFPEWNNAYYIPVFHQDGKDPDNLSEAFLHVPAMEDAITRATWIGFNSKFDMHFMDQAGFKLRNVEDVMIAAHLHCENEELFTGNYKLKDLSRYYLGSDFGVGEDDLYATMKAQGLGKGDMWQLPAKDVAFYGAMDAYITWELRQFYITRLTEWDQLETYRDRNEVMTKGYYHMERNGIHVSPEQIVLSVEESHEYARQLERDITLIVGYPLNPNSPAQLKEAFARLGVKLPSTDKRHLEGLSNQPGKVGQLAQLILDLRPAKKGESTYYKPYRDALDSNNRVHPNFNMASTNSGRMSSSNPNLQQLPRKSDKYPVKKIFTPTDGWVLCQFDYKNLEAFLVAGFVKEPTYIEMFTTGGDLHQLTADRLTKLLGRPISRYFGKQANFSFFYGMGVEKAMLNFGVDEKTAKDLLRWHELYPNVRAGYQSAQALAKQWRYYSNKTEKKAQYIRLMNGRVRHYSDYVKAYNDEHGYVVGAPITVLTDDHLNFSRGTIISRAIDTEEYKCAIEVRSTRQKKTLWFKSHEIEPSIPYYTAFNFLIQGTAAVVNEYSVLQLGREYNQDDPDVPVRLIGAIHDSIVVEVQKELFDMVVPQIKALMESFEFHPPLKVSVEASTKSWYDMWDFTTKENGKEIVHPITLEELLIHETV